MASEWMCAYTPKDAAKLNSLFIKYLKEGKENMTDFTNEQAKKAINSFEDIPEELRRLADKVKDEETKSKEEEKPVQL